MYFRRCVYVSLIIIIATNMLRTNKLHPCYSSCWSCRVCRAALDILDHSWRSHWRIAGWLDMHAYNLVFKLTTSKQLSFRCFFLTKGQIGRNRMAVHMAQGKNGESVTNALNTQHQHDKTVKK